MIQPSLSERAPDQVTAPSHVGGGELFVVRAPARTGDPTGLWTALHGLLPSRTRRCAGARPWISAELVGRAGRVQLQLWVPAGQAPFVAALVRGAYPGAELVPADEDALELTPDAIAGVSRVHLRDAWRPVRTDHDHDALAALFATLARAGDHERIVVAFAVRPRPDGWQRRARRNARRLAGGSPRFVDRVLHGDGASMTAGRADTQAARAIEEKAERVGFDVAIRVLTRARTQAAADEYLRAVAASLRVVDGSTGLSFERLRTRQRERVATQMRERTFPASPTSVLTAPELAALWHLPVDKLPHVDVVDAPKLAVPAEVPSDGRVIGVADFPGRERPVAIPWSQTSRHTLIDGPSGAGKTVLIDMQAIQDIHAGRAVMVFDPGDGSLCRSLLAQIPAGRDVVWITPDDPTVSVTVNLLERVPAERRELVAERVVAIFRARWSDSWGPRSDALAKAAVLAVLHQSDASLAMVARMLVDPALRRRVLADIDDPTGVGIRAFWNWFEQLSDAQKNEVIAPLSTKLTDFLIRSRLRRVLCGRSTIDLRRMLDNRAVILVDLAPGKWGPGAAELVGSFLFAAVVQAVLERADTPETDRPDVALYLDEFQNFIGGVPGTIESALAQLRKYGCSITLATQSLVGLPRSTRDAIGTNTRTKCLFGLGLDDARHFAAEFAPLTAEQLTRLGPHQVALRVALAGTTSRPFTARARPPVADDPARAAAIGARAIARWTRPVEQIDTDLAYTLAPPAPPASAGPVGRRSRPR